ncbi:hypothetical protein ABQ482_27675, partial [Raoultella ornithinolytica]
TSTWGGLFLPGIRQQILSDWACLRTGAHNVFYVKYQSITLRSQSLQRHISVAATTRPLR